CPPNAAAVESKVFACDGSGTYQMYGTYQPSTPVINFIGIQGQIDIIDHTGAVSPFWAFELGGCNEASFASSDARGTTNPVCNIATQFGATGSAGTDVFQYVQGLGSNRRLHQFPDAPVPALPVN